MTNPQISFNEILVELKKYNPHASADDISAGVISILEREILPRAIRYMTLPDFPSWVDMSIRKSGRLPKKRLKSTESLEKRRITIQQIEGVKRELYWDGGTVSKPTDSFPDAGFIISRPEMNLSSAWQLIQPEEKSVIPIEQPNDPYGRRLSLPRERFQIVLQKEIQEKIISDVLFEDVFRKIETSIRELVDSRNLEGSIDVSFRTDHEITSWNKYVIAINLPSQIEFKERTKIWTIFDLTIRNKLRELADKADGEMKEYLNDLNKKLFVHIKL